MTASAKTAALKKPVVAALIIFVVTLAADQVTKQWAYHTLVNETFHAQTDAHPACTSPDAELDRARLVYRTAAPIEVVPHMFNFRYVENCANAFGMLQKVPAKVRFPLLLVISFLACIVIPYMFVKTPSDHRFMLYALPFVLGGALGNLLDRMIYRFVIDFVDWYVVLGGKEYHWPTFNIADVAIVIGIGLMILQMLPGGRKNTSADSAKEADAQPKKTPGNA
ncbi:MAG: signal peptidase II [Proteobacteria bacterium]|nr:signal peptidase II [Pseudomonadota bacterium]